jgi:hypothetical protein
MPAHYGFDIETGAIRLFEGHLTFEDKVRNFPPNVYRLEETDHLRNLLWVLLEDAGCGTLRRVQAHGQAAETLAGTVFGDLDAFFGQIFGLRRTGEESYDHDPFSDPLTADEWAEVEAKDASYRERIDQFMQALMRGGTNEGIAMAAEAACGLPCQVIELWRLADSVQGVTGRTGHNKEFVIIPMVPTDLDPDSPEITASQERAIVHAVNRLKPANTFCTVEAGGLGIHKKITVRQAYSDSEYFEVRRYISGKSYRDRFFHVADGVEQEAPSFAYLVGQEDDWSLNGSVSNVQALRLFGSYRGAPTPLTSDVQQWGQWRAIEIADSPDNFPEGKYPGDQNRYSEAGVYQFAWASQAAYRAWFDAQVEDLGGQIDGDNWRLPTSHEVTQGNATDPAFSLSPPEIYVSSTYFLGDS